MEILAELSDRIHEVNVPVAAATGPGICRHMHIHWAVYRLYGFDRVVGLAYIDVFVIHIRSVDNAAAPQVLRVGVLWRTPLRAVTKGRIPDAAIAAGLVPIMAAGGT